MRILCLKHVSFEGPGAIADWAAARGHRLRELEVFRGGGFPDLEDFDFLLVMGGPMNVDEHEAHPWLPEEKALIRSAIEAGKVVFGVCLGAQLIARVLGAAVRPNARKEIGWFPIVREPTCPAGFELPGQLRVFHWHGDRFELPEGAVRLARSEACAEQGFLYAERVLAWQCHLETTADSLEALARHCADELTDGPHIQSAEALCAEPEASYGRMRAVLFAQLDRLCRAPS